MNKTFTELFVGEFFRHPNHYFKLCRKRDKDGYTTFFKEESFDEGYEEDIITIYKYYVSNPLQEVWDSGRIE